MLEPGVLEPGVLVRAPFDPELLKQLELLLRGLVLWFGLHGRSGPSVGVAFDGDGTPDLPPPVFDLSFPSSPGESPVWVEDSKLFDSLPVEGFDHDGNYSCSFESSVVVPCC